MTNRQAISEIRSTHRLLSADGKINDRTILREAIGVNLLFVRQQTDKRRLWASPNLFTQIPCIEFEKVSIGECCEFVSDKYIAKSVQEIPKIAEGIYGLLVQMVANPERSKVFVQLTPREYINVVELGLEGMSVYWWIWNKHLYISNPDTEIATLSAFFEEDVPNSLLYPEPDCPCQNPVKEEDLCKNPLDNEFKHPGYLIDAIKDKVSKTLLEKYFNIPQDNTNDNKDDQARNNIKQG